MKKILNNILILFSITTFLVGCEQEDYTVLSDDANTVVSLDVSEVVLVPENADQNALTVSWTDPDFGYNAGVVYQVTFTNIDQETTVSAGTDLSKAFETTQLNKMLLGIGLAGDTPTPVDVKVTIVLSAYKQIVSNTSTFTATIYEDKLDLSTEWGVVGSATPNGWDGPDVPFFTTSESNVLVAYPTLTDGEIKFRTNNSWVVNYGDTGLDGALDSGGDNIPVSAGMYKILMNVSTLTYTIEPFTWGLVGDATENSWDGPDMPLTYDSYSDTWKAIVTLGTGEWKFRLNNDWSVNYGDTGLDGALESGGDNIPVTAGNYLVIFDANAATYTIEPIDIWGIVGDAAPNGWDGPNARLSLDYSQEDVWYINNIAMGDGEFKFRTNDSWDVNLGDTGLDGVLEAGGDNIPVTAGTYNITLEFSNPDAPTYTITAQ
ncbi:SusE domain-containing protein [Lutibacter holmesii]|uniref:SusE domain-containing protein n=1 Tax=Lutibacter holmesii TaxID=1137985 RepID=A0ABW3WRJ0_9FLAO